MTKWTPGPWIVVIDDDGNPLSGRPSIQASDELDCGIVHWDGFIQEYWRSARGDKEIHANAHLIAAAPELYTALVALLNTVDNIRGIDMSFYAEAEMSYAEDVLKKARGEV